MPPVHWPGRSPTACRSCSAGPPNPDHSRLPFTPLQPKIGLFGRHHRRAQECGMTDSRMTDRLGTLQADVAASLADMVRDRVVPRLWAKDHTLWRPDPKEITNRLGWL